MTTPVVPRAAPTRARRPPAGAALGVLALLAVALVPLCALAVWSVAGTWFYPALVPTSWSFDSWAGLARGSALAAAALTSVALGLGVATVGCALAVPVGRLLAGLPHRYRHLAVAAVMLPAAAPPIVLATGLQLSFLAIGLGGTTVGVAAAHLVPVVGVLSFYFFAVFTAFDRRVEAEARSLGATPVQVWTRVTLPLLRRELLAAAALGFILSWGQVPLTLIIGEGVVHTLSADVLAYAAAGQHRYAAAGALLLMLPAVLMIRVARRLGHDASD